MLLTNIDGNESVYQSLRDEELTNPSYFQQALDAFICEEFGFSLSLLNEPQEEFLSPLKEEKVYF